MSESDDQAARRDYFTLYAAIAGTGFAVFLCLAYVGAFYLRTGDFVAGLSFRADDWPANAGPTANAAYALGVHYFGDFLATWLQSDAASPYVTGSAIWPSNYPPFTHLLFKLLTWMSYRTSLAVYLAVSSAAILIPIWIALRGRPASQRVLLVVIGVVLTAPFISVLDRGNVQGIVSGLVIVTALLLLQNRNYGAAVCIGVAAALKGYPIVLVSLLIRRRCWKESIIALSTFTALTLLSLWSFEGGLTANLRGFWNATSPFRNLDVGKETAAPAHNNSIYALLQVARDQAVPAADAMLSHYWIVAALVTIAAIVVALLPRATLVEQFVALCAFMVLTPTITGTYALTLFFAPLVLLAQKRSSDGPFPTLYAVLIGVMVVPKGLPIQDNATIASVANPLVALALLAAAAAHAGYRPTSRSRSLDGCVEPQGRSKPAGDSVDGAQLASGR